MAPPQPAYTWDDFNLDPTLCKKTISRLTKQIIQLYDVLLEFFRVNAEMEVYTNLPYLHQDYDNLDEKRQRGYNPYMSRLIQEVASDIRLDDLKIVRAEIKIWKKLWQLWGPDTRFIPWARPNFLRSDDPNDWSEGKELYKLMDTIEQNEMCLRCSEPYDEETNDCPVCASIHLPLVSCLELIIALIRHLYTLYRFIIRNDIYVSEDTYRNRCLAISEHPYHGPRGHCRHFGNWWIPPRIREYLKKYPHGFAPLDAISDVRLRKYVMKVLLQKFPYLRFGISKFIQNPEIMGEDFARFLAIPMPVSQTFGYIYEAIDTGDIDWLEKNIHLLLQDDYPPGSSYTNIEDDMKLETKYLGNEPLPLTLAIKARPSDHRHEIIKWLIELGFDVNARDRVNDGRTPLMEAVRQNDLKTVKLIRKAAKDQKVQIDFSERDTTGVFGASVFDLAESNPTIQEYLETWAPQPKRENIFEGVSTDSNIILFPAAGDEKVIREDDGYPDTIPAFDGWEDSDDVAIPGTVWLIAENDPEFKGEDFERQVTDVTWKQLADEIIPAIIDTTGNKSHVFLVELQKTGQEDESGVPSYYVAMSS